LGVLRLLLLGWRCLGLLLSLPIARPWLLLLLLQLLLLL
jgi:hypothetical protein